MREVSILGLISDRGRCVVFVGKTLFSYSSCLRIEDRYRPNAPVASNADFLHLVWQRFTSSRCSYIPKTVNCNLDLIYLVFNKI